MTISAIQDKYLVVTSDFITDVINNPGNYQSLEVDGVLNCCTNNCGNDVAATVLLDLTSNAWKIDLTNGVNSNLIVTRLQLINPLFPSTVVESTIAIDLSYVAANCGDPSGICTLADFSGHFAPLFKAAIDDLINLSFPASSNVTISFDGNTVIVTDLPNNSLLPFTLSLSDDNDNPVYWNYSTANSNVALISPSSLLITPQFFGKSSFVDGIYDITLIFTKEDGDSTVTEHNCYFDDITMKCKVAATLKTILKDSAGDPEQIATNVHMLHYALVNGSNCGCNCQEMCDIFKALVDLTSNIDPQILADCGCS